MALDIEESRVCVCFYFVIVIPYHPDFFFFFFFNDTATTEIYTLSLHDALPICKWRRCCFSGCSKPATPDDRPVVRALDWVIIADRKSTRLNSSHLVISYAVFCLKKKKNSCGRSFRPSRYLVLLARSSHTLNYQH